MIRFSIRPTYRLISLLFFFSGFCGLLYQLIWMRLAFASFGINMPVMSVVLSVFMAGLGLGSWCGGIWAARWVKSSAARPMVFYAIAEILIGVGAFVVPCCFSWGERLLLGGGTEDSASYLFASALVLLVSLLPWCFCMGTTFPFMMAFLRKASPIPDSFSFLYTANVFGALVGVLVTAGALIEILGFHHALITAASINFLIGAIGLAIAKQFLSKQSPARKATTLSTLAPTRHPTLSPYIILFLTGFTCMALEVIWTRAFTIILSTLVYSYASLLFSYLLATMAGAFLYRRDLRREKILSNRTLLGLAALFSLLPVILNDTRFHHTIAGVLGSIVPFCLVLGYLTPKLVDTVSSGDPKKAGWAYAWNVFGCILGPLAASYFLLPHISSKAAMILLSLPLLYFCVRSHQASLKPLSFRTLVLPMAVLALLLQSVWGTISYEEKLSRNFPSSEIYRDYAATVQAAGQKRPKYLFVNGINMTGMVTATKVMAHLPLVYLTHPPHSSLDICFGMGTTFRSLRSWNIQATAVDLVPGVFRAFPFFHADAPALLQNPKSRLVVDDGRRFLRESNELYDIITIDPPPPVEAAGSSLLYSVEFYDLAKTRLVPGGILQQWFPNGDLKTFQAIARALFLSFPHVKVHESLEGGYHFIASNSSLSTPTLAQALQRMPPEAQRDLMEWVGPSPSIRDYLQATLKKEVDIQNFLNPDTDIVIRDDKPYNEYYLCRQTVAAWRELLKGGI
jgi:spermidine synthase